MNKNTQILMLFHQSVWNSIYDSVKNCSCFSLWQLIHNSIYWPVSDVVSDSAQGSIIQSIKEKFIK